MSTSTAALQNTCVALLEQIAAALGGEFSIYLPQLMPLFLQVLHNDQSTNRIVTRNVSVYMFVSVCVYVCACVFFLCVCVSVCARRRRVYLCNQETLPEIGSISYFLCTVTLFLEL